MNNDLLEINIESHNIDKVLEGPEVRNIERLETLLSSLGLPNDLNVDLRGNKDVFYVINALAFALITVENENGIENIEQFNRFVWNENGYNIKFLLNRLSSYPSVLISGLIQRMLRYITDIQFLPAHAWNPEHEESNKEHIARILYHVLNASHNYHNEEIEKLCDGKPDALYLLSGVSEIKDPETGAKRYKPGAWSDVDWNGFMTGGKGRALAVVELAKRFPDAKVAVNSNTFNVNDDTAPTDAVVMAEYVGRMGVDNERILQQDRSTTTFTELIELIKYIAKYKWEHVVVVAGETQNWRAEAMFPLIVNFLNPLTATENPYFAKILDTPEIRTALEEALKINPKVTFVSAEDILPYRDARYASVITEAKESDNWKKRETLDRASVEQINNGTYGQQKKS